MTTITMKEVAAFLLGEAPLDGFWFGERHPAGGFWWREHLRAALSAPATAPDLSAAYIGAREDLAVWKKRALEAEETARQLNRALAEEVNGPTFMGEPVLPATAQAAEIERLKTESEERLQNCAALVAEVERLRKDAERYQWLAEYLVSDDESYDDAIVAATTVKEVDSVIDNAMKGTS